MSTEAGVAGGAAPARARTITRDVLMGNVSRWRRFGEPVPAGGSRNADGTPDYGLIGPGTIAWEVLLHPTTILFESIAQGLLQLTYKPITAGIRDHDPISRKARAGTLTFFDAFERFQRNAGMHAPLWLGDSTTARTMAEHIHRVHRKVAALVIDTGEPELGGYDATAPRESLWAALTELHAILRMYEAFAFRGGWLPRRLRPADRDRFYAECAPYVRLMGADEADVPRSAADVAALYARDRRLFGHTDTIDIIPETSQRFEALSAEVMKRNFEKSQIKAIVPLMLQFLVLKFPVFGALPRRARINQGMSTVARALSVAARYISVPVFGLAQLRPVERRIMRLMWGPDGVALIESARRLHREALANRAPRA